MIQLELKKHGKTKYNSFWGYGVVTDSTGLFSYTGIVQFKDEYNLTDNSTYVVKSIDLYFNKKNLLQVTLALK